MSTDSKKDLQKEMLKQMKSKKIDPTKDKFFIYENNHVIAIKRRHYCFSINIYQVRHVHKCLAIFYNAYMAKEPPAKFSCPKASNKFEVEAPCQAVDGGNPCEKYGEVGDLKKNKVKDYIKKIKTKDDFDWDKKGRQEVIIEGYLKRFDLETAYDEL